MTITAYTDENFSSEYKSALELPINPICGGQAVRELERVERICTLPSGDPLL